MKSQKSIGYCSNAMLVILLLLGLSTATHSGQASMNQLHLQALQRSEGIYDRVVQKLQQKEEAQKKFVQEQVNQQLLMQEQQQINQQREILTNSPYPSTLEGDLQDVQQAIKDIDSNGKVTPKKPSYEEQIEQIAQQQEAENQKYKDDYEGFGSLTEMVKNKEVIAEKKAVTEAEVQEKKQKDEEEKKKRLEKYKAKMTAALNKEVEERKQNQIEEANKQKAQEKIRKLARETSLLAISTKKEKKKPIIIPKKIVVKKPIVKKIIKPKVILPKKKTLVVLPKAGKTSGLASLKAKAQQILAKSTHKSAASSLEGSPPSSSELISVGSNETQQIDEAQQAEEAQKVEENTQKDTNNTVEGNKTKLYDGSVSQVIDEVQTEQEAKVAEQKYKSSLPKVPQESKEEEQQGYLSQFRKKFSDLRDPPSSDNQEVQVASEIDVQETAKKGHKGIRERFSDQIEQETSDQEKTQALIHTAEADIKRSKKQNLLERESERLMREQNEELTEDLNE